jgi:hypothetical protein
MALSVFFVIIALVAAMGYAVPPRPNQPDEMGCDGRVPS